MDLDEKTNEGMIEELRKEEEKNKEKIKRELANSINESSSFISSLLNKLSQTDDDNRRSIICSMLVDEYKSSRSKVDEYKNIGGEYYSIDRGLWRYLMGY